MSSENGCIFLLLLALSNIHNTNDVSRLLPYAM